MPALASAVFNLRNTLRTWEARRSSRRRLAKLDQYILADIGMDATAANAEIRKPFWRA
ncbi:DUF1127 domain-containing protein [Falsirhodobacter sp. alg1]|uniref:DUF1127 domain-containing protein n=1 Tax=Falsirhodobacter sp. alg1 TaxID=1472418 RepID=UPI00128EF2E1|nr:DUF1127 domain-containing protein [Falsirhodobacter sp. alg1]